MEDHQGPLAFSVRPAVEAEVDVAVAIDDDASQRYVETDIVFDLQRDHPFLVAEYERWREAARDGRLLFACGPGGEPIGMTAFYFVDGHPHLEQVSVRRAWMGRGVGRALIALALRWSAPQGELWLTTYGHVAWNRPFYERLGFVVVAEAACGPELRATLADERGALPFPEHRVAMVYRHPRHEG